MMKKKGPKSGVRAKKVAAPAGKAPAPAGKAPASGRKRPRGDENGLAMLVRFGAASADVLGAQPGTISPPRRELRPPLVTPLTFTTIPPGGGEIWASFHDANRQPIAVNAWSRRPRYFGDVPDPRSGVPGALRGGMMKPTFDDRFLHLEVPRDAAYLLFWRIRVVSVGRPPRSPGKGKPLVGSGPYGDVRFEWELLGAYSLKDKVDRILREPLSFPFPIKVKHADWIAVVAALRTFQKRWRGELIFPPRGRIVDQRTVLDNGDPAEHFNIVITGDGFVEADIDEFEWRAMKIVDGLLTEKPFSDHTARLNIHLIHAVSLVSGIQVIGGAAAGSTPTYYGVQGAWPDPTLPADVSSYAGYCGTSAPWRVYDAALDFAPADQIQLFIVIANCPAPGGSAFHDQRIAFVTSGTPSSQLAITALHESGHVIGGLGEEYISPLPWDGVTQFHNVIDRAKREYAWWKQLASAAELDAGGRFKHVHDCPDGGQGTECQLASNSPWLVPSEDPGHLGLFWGAQFVDPDESVAELLETWEWDSQWRDTRGNNFFRGRAGCRMRTLDWPFCEVCVEEMTSIINDPSL